MPVSDWPHDGLSREEKIDRLFSQNFCNEEHIQAFSRALGTPDEESGPPSPVETFSSFGQSHSSKVANSPQQPRVHKVSAVSDFAPIHTKVKRRRRGAPHVKQEKLYQIFRWPLLILLNTIIGIEFGMYVLIRQIVNAFEWLLAWRGPKGVLRSHLRSARSWDEWKQAANAMDEYLGFNEWKKNDEDTYYDHSLVRKVRRSLRTYRQNNDVRALMGVLEVCLRDNFAGAENPRLYSETFIGTKDAIEAYIKEVEDALAFVRSTRELSDEEKRRFFRNACRSFGSSALCFSGGGAFGFYHFGVLKAFLDTDLMPRVFNGTSAGGLTAAFACTHTDEELRLMTGPRLADHITCFEESFSTTLSRLFQTGAMFDTLAWARKSMFFTRGSMTFREAYERTGKVLNVSVIPSDRHSPTKLLNYLTAPDCIIWSAIIASSAVPTILNPVVLMQKTKYGQVVPWNWGGRFKDGSLRVDVPIQSLNLLFNVNNTIVSQVNPHVHLFFFASRGSPGRPVAHRKGKGWRGGFLLSAAEQFLKLELTKNFKVIRDLELMPQILGQDWSSVFLQRFDGSVTIRPRTIAKDFLRILSDPTRTEMQRMQHAGELATWPRLHMVENRFRIEREIFRGRLAFRQLDTRGISRRVGVPLPGPETNTPDFRPEVNPGTPADRKSGPKAATLATPLIPVRPGAELDEERTPKYFKRRSRIGVEQPVDGNHHDGFTAEDSQDDHYGDDEHHRPIAITSQASLQRRRHRRTSPQTFPRSIARGRNLSSPYINIPPPSTSDGGELFSHLRNASFPRLAPFGAPNLSEGLSSSLSSDDTEEENDHDETRDRDPPLATAVDWHESSSDSIEDADVTWEVPLHNATKTDCEPSVTKPVQDS